MRTVGAPLPRLMLVTDGQALGGRPWLDVVAAAVAGGATFVQVREKDVPEALLRDWVRALVARVPTATTVVLNDRPALARFLGLGLHLPEAAVAPGGPRPPLLGRSVHSLEAARRALAEAADYLVLGTIFPTASHPGHPGEGLALVRAVAAVAGDTPVYAIGGITAENAAAVVAAGAYGVAVRGAILTAADPEAAARFIAARLEAACGPRAGSV